MQRTLIKKLNENIDKEVTVSCWVDARRDHGKLIFLVLRDRSGTAQAIVTPKSPEALAVAEHLRDEWVVNITGKVKARPENMVKTEELNGDIELSISAIEVLAEAQELPFQKEAEVNQDVYLNNLPLTLRRQKSRDVFVVQATIVKAFREILRENDFIEYQSPVLVGGDAEGGADAFKVAYYKDKNAYLATSPQLYKQILVGVFERVFSIGKVFRAEKHATPRHTSEYSSLDFEMGFIKDYMDVMAMTETVHKHIARTVAGEHTDILQRVGVEAPLVPDTFPILKLTEAQEILEREFGSKAVGEPDLEPVHERQICEWAKKEHNSDYIFITHYPVEKRPFYTYEDEENLGTTKTFDLLFRGVEITTGGQRIHDYATLVANIKKWGLNPEAFSFYLQAFKSGMPPHGGTGNGLERITELMLGLSNVREATLFPRDMNRIDTLLSKEE